MRSDYKNKSQTAFGVAIICGAFVLETAQITRGHLNAGTQVVLGILTIVFVGTVVAGIHFHRKMQALPAD